VRVTAIAIGFALALAAPTEVKAQQTTERPRAHRHVRTDCVIAPVVAAGFKQIQNTCNETVLMAWCFGDEEDARSCSSGWVIMRMQDREAFGIASANRQVRYLACAEERMEVGAPTTLRNQYVTVTCRSAGDAAGYTAVLDAPIDATLPPPPPAPPPPAR
jgi:hypothetical protein